MRILVMKETRAGEKRVALVPHDIRRLVEKDYIVFVEHNAGKAAGFLDGDYQKAGAEIRTLDSHQLDGYAKLFKGIDLIVRAKRPERSREKLENEAIKSGTIMIGALDPLEKNSSHIDEYHQAGIIAYSIDQLNLERNDPMNVLAAMSKIAGKLALLDAIVKFHGSIHKVVIIGYGVVGQAAFEAALNRNLPTTVILSNPDDAIEIEQHQGRAVRLDRNADILQQQEMIKNELSNADIVITSARRANQPAPLLIPMKTLSEMPNGSVIVDMALSEGGNVEGSVHDETLQLGNGVIVTNTSGYPKALPHEASKLWSTASLRFILSLEENTKNAALISSE